MVKKIFKHTVMQSRKHLFKDNCIKVAGELNLKIQIIDDGFTQGILNVKLHYVIILEGEQEKIDEFMNCYILP